MVSPTLFVLAAAASIASAKPVLVERAGCTFTTAAAAISGASKCSTVTLNNIAVPAGTTLDLTKLAANTKVIFAGTTTFGYKEWEGPLISVAGTGIEVSSAAGAKIDCQGQRWWDTKGSNGGKTKPKFFAAHKMINSKITGLKVINTPVQAFSINEAKNLGVYDINIDNSAGDSGGGHNTDAFDVGSSTGVYISGAYIRNQDDCLAINSGTNITFTNGYCSGGHGLSIGSVGGRSDNVVSGVTITNSQICDSDNGVRIKTVYGATGSVSGVTYSGITLSNIARYGIVIEQDYQNGSPTGTPTAGVPITDVTIKNIKGTVASSGTDVYILCASCSKWSWSGVSVTGGKTSTKCKGIPTGASC
ncbi:Polygalacturonase 1 [Ceratocystis pirilliformis]|uniref:endo-polygalacturonase n=1 Tax=Ceratocystis pirilliformis TaxID=259994 RepID=A0ABR3ZKW1_9PEZI